MSTLNDRYLEVRQRIAAAESQAGREAGAVKLVVITKNHPAQLVLDLIDIGARDFGENRDQEAQPKSVEVAAARAQKIDWHFVGQLQSNKARSALSYASVLHSLDRDSLLQAVAKIAPERDNPLQVFIQLNLTDDPGRGGIEPVNLKAFAEKVLAIANLNLLGVMGVASLERAPEFDFETIARCSADLQSVAPSASYISAGMSGDYESAISFGATHVRIGTAITGNRQY